MVDFNKLKTYEKFVPERIQHPFLPDEIKVSFQPLIKPKKTKDHEQDDLLTGSAMIRKMVKQYFGHQVDLHLTKNEKPKAYCNGREISVSFSHTSKALSAAISEQFFVGCDMESVSRNVSPGLIKRIKEKEESNVLYSEIEPIRIWTLKESALKMIGTGLRRPMNSIRIEQLEPDLFSVEFFNKKRSKICSFKYQEHWITICYQEK